MWHTFAPNRNHLNDFGRALHKEHFCDVLLMSSKWIVNETQIAQTQAIIYIIIIIIIYSSRDISVCLKILGVISEGIGRENNSTSSIYLSKDAMSVP